MISDVTDYSRLVHRLGAADLARLMRAYERIVRARLPNKRTEVDHAPDGFHLVFAAPRDALRTAIEIAEALSRHNAKHPDQQLSTGFGIEVGASTTRAGAYFGAAPVVASRLAVDAQGGQVLVTGAVRALISSLTAMRDLGTWTIAGQPIRIYEARPPDPGQPSTDRRGIVHWTAGWMGGGRFLSTLFFTDIVRSTATAVAVGDRQWRELVERHHATVRDELARHGGSEIDTAGDGFYASFDAPSDAIQCAIALRDHIRPTGLEIRIGIHVGECEIVAGKVGGVAAAVGARVKDLAQAGEILVSRTVRDVVIGTALVFEERGVAELRGVQGRWELYAVAPSADVRA